jgi:hypothetical protein
VRLEMLFENKRKWGKLQIEKHENSENFVFENKNFHFDFHSIPLVFLEFFRIY